jgi:hypothetical protein
MITLAFVFMMIWVFGKLTWFAIRASWGLMKVMFTLVFFPLVLIGMVIGGLAYIAFPVLAVVGAVSLLGCNDV